MAGQLPIELYIDLHLGGPDAVERLCAQATNRPAPDVVAVAVTPAQVAQASELLFGTGIGVVSTIDDPVVDITDQARRSVAAGATEIAVPWKMLNEATTLQQLRSRLGLVTPLTIGLTAADGTLDLAIAERALRLGADFVSFCPRATSPTARQDIAGLLTLAGTVNRGRVKIAAAPARYASLLRFETDSTTPWPGLARLRVPLWVANP